MTKLEQLELSEPVTATYVNLEHDLLVKISEQIASGKGINNATEWRITQLAKLGMVSKGNMNLISASADTVSAQYREAVTGAVKNTVQKLGTAVDEGILSDRMSETLKAFDKQAKDKLNQVNTVMKYKADSSYVNAVNSVFDKWTKAERREQSELINKQEYLNILNVKTAGVSTGTMSMQQAVRETINEMCDRGIPAFVDKAGREWSPEAYISMDIRTTVANVARQAQFTAMREDGQDVVEISTHSNARERCAPYQGKFYSISGKSGIIYDVFDNPVYYAPLSSTSYGEPAGLFGINCGHNMYPVTDGRFARTYEPTEDEIEAQREYVKKTAENNIKREAALNKTKADCLKAAGDKEGAEVYSSRAKQIENTISKNLDNPDKSGIIVSDGGKASSKNIEKPIEQRHTGKGKPGAILHFGVPLNNRQQELLDMMPDYDSRVLIPKKRVNMSDLAAITASTGDEFALFTKGNERLIIRGNKTMVNIDVKAAEALADQGYKWSGHTHPGTDSLCMQPSEGDYAVLSRFKHKNGVIYNSKGDYRLFYRRE